MDTKEIILLILFVDAYWTHFDKLILMMLTLMLMLGKLASAHPTQQSR